MSQGSKDIGYPAGEDTFLQHAADLEAYHRSTLGSKPVQPAIISDLRRTLIVHYSTAALNNRKIHWAKAVARSKDVTALMLALFMTFVLVFAILLNDVITH